MREGGPNKVFLGTIFYDALFLGYIFEPELIFNSKNGGNRFLL
jgi:hypothetical protein